MNENEPKDLVVWNASFALNIGEIDSQHRTLVESTNMLWHALKDGQDDKMMNQLVDCPNR